MATTNPYDQYGTGNYAGRDQIINGQTYKQYSPEWYAKMRETQVRGGSTAGQTAAAYTSEALKGFPSIAGLTGGSGSVSGASGAGGGAGTGVTGGGGGNGVPSVGGLELPNMDASNSATFSRAKDAVGQQSRAALTSLNDELGAQGQIGGGAQVQGTRDIIQSGAGNLGEVSRDLAIQNSNQAADFAKTRYSGGITQRGQDIQSQEAAAQLELARQQQQQNTLFRLLSLATQGLSSSYSSDQPVY
jgi:hypothetical protein